MDSEYVVTIVGEGIGKKLYFAVVYDSWGDKVEQGDDYGTPEEAQADLEAFQKTYGKGTN